MLRGGGKDRSELLGRDCFSGWEVSLQYGWKFRGNGTDSDAVRARYLDQALIVFWCGGDLLRSPAISSAALDLDEIPPESKPLTLQVSLSSVHFTINIILLNPSKFHLQVLSFDGRQVLFSKVHLLTSDIYTHLTS